MILINNTPVIPYYIGHTLILVKREDLSANPPAPPFSKMRGVIKHLQSLKNRGVTVVGYTETSISMAGWGIAYGCNELGMKAVIFDPQYIKTPPTLAFHRLKWDKFGAIRIPLKAGMAKVNWNISKSILRERYGLDAVLLPLGLPFPETVTETENEFIRSFNHIENEPNSIIINVGSGTIASGVWRGAESCFKHHHNCTIYGIMGRTGNTRRKMKAIEKKAKLSNTGLMKSNVRFSLIDPHWNYTHMSLIKTPFPCNPYYDKKAWEWLTKSLNLLKPPILFWNIGK